MFDDLSILIESEEILSDLDFVLDIFGPNNVETSLKVVKPGGTIFSTALMEVPGELAAKGKEKNVTISGLLVQSSAEDMNKIREMMEKGELKSTIHKTFPMEQMREAHTAVENGGLVGKVVVTV